MDGHAKRTKRKQENIKKSALELFNKYGVDKVSMDEIASKSNVSKVTIYKYFNSKENLCKEVIKMVYTETFNDIEEIINSQFSFIDKLKFIISSKIKSTKVAQGRFLQEVIKNNYEINEFIYKGFEKRKEELMFNFFDQGKRDGYISNDISNEVLLLYVEIFQTGLNRKLDYIKDLSINSNIFEQMIDLYFFGIINIKN